jgi:hypothetical protein
MLYHYGRHDGLLSDVEEKESYIMFETSVIAAAMINDLKREMDKADRRAFYGPDAIPSTEESRRKIRVPRFLRRGSDVA